MKVLLFSTGMYHFWIHLANALPHYCELEIIVPYSAKRSEPFQFLEENSNVHYFRKYRIWDLRNLVTLCEILNKIRKINPDIIHFPGGKPVWFPLVYPILRKRYPLVMTVHEPVPKYGAPSMKWYEQFVINMNLSYGDAIIVTGEKLKEATVRYRRVEREKLFSIPLGVYAIFGKSAKKETTEEVNTILFFGKIYPYKGLDYLIKAEPIISKEIADIKIIIAGKGEDFSKYKRMMRSQKKFEIYNYYVSFEEAAELFQRASVVVLPYIRGSQSGVVSTAYAFGKPVITTKVGSIPEIVENRKTGIIVPPRDVNALSNAIVKLLRNKELREEMRRNIQKKVEKELSWERIAKETVGVYRLVLQKRSGVIRSIFNH